MKDGYYLDARVAEAYDADTLMTDDVAFYVGLAKETGDAGVLELAAGTGRVTIPMARAGVPVVGLDRSPAMLTVARRKARGLGRVEWVEGDMAGFDLGRRFGLVIIPFRSFLLLLSVAEQKSCLACVREHLVPGGRLAFNIFNPSIPLMAEWLTTRRGGLERRRDGAPGTEVWATRRYGTAGQNIDEQRIEERLGDDGAVIARVYRNLRQRYVFRYEMEHLLALSGLAVEALYGWFDRRPFDDESSEMVWIARPA